MSIIDQVSDQSGVHLHRISRIFPLPSFVKMAERITLEDVKSIAPATFADRSGRRYPCHTKSATYLSWLYFLDSEPDMQEKQARSVRENLDRMATVWGISGPNGPVTMLKKAFAKRAADAWPDLTDEDYGLIVDGHKLFPMPNAVSVKKAAEHLYANRDKYPYQWRKIAATRILHKAAEKQAELAEDTSEFLCKSAGYGFSTAEQLRAGLLKRAAAIAENPRMQSAAAAMRKYADEIAELTINGELLEKTASFLDELDRRLGLHKKYVTKYSNQVEIPLPEEVVFSTTEKQAQEKMSKVVILTNGEAYTKDDLEKAGHNTFCVALGDDVEDAMFDPVTKRLDVEKAAEVLPTLPRDDADNLSTALYAAGVRPVEIMGKRGQMLKAAGVSYDAAMDLSSWKNMEVNEGRKAHGINPRILTRADEIGAVSHKSNMPTFVI